MAGALVAAVAPLKSAPDRVPVSDRSFQALTPPPGAAATMLVKVPVTAPVVKLAVSDPSPPTAV